MKKIKSALEIAMSKADAISQEVTPEDEKGMELKEKAKEILSHYFRDSIDADGLWQELKKEEDALLLKEVQEALIETLSLKGTPEDLKKRQKGILAVENLKEGQMGFMVDRILNQMVTLQKEYQDQVGDLNKMLQEELKNKSKMKMRPVRTPDGRTVMQASPSIDEERRRQISSSYEEAENRFSRRFQELKSRLKEELG